MVGSAHGLFRDGGAAFNVCIDNDFGEKSGMEPRVPSTFHSTPLGQVTSDAPSELSSGAHVEPVNHALHRVVVHTKRNRHFFESASFNNH